MGTATGRAYFIRIQSFEEYSGNDQIGDGRTTKSVLRKPSKYFKRSRFSYVKVGPWRLEQLVVGLSKNQGMSELVNLEARTGRESGM